MAEYRLRRRREFERRVRRLSPSPTLGSLFTASIKSKLCASAWSDYALWEESQLDLPRARAVWERAVAALPLADQLWLHYAQLEELAGDVAGARHVFDRWLARRPRPDPDTWEIYALLELRHGEVGRARAIYERLLRDHPRRFIAFLLYAEFEMQHGGGAPAARRVYERAVAAVDPAERPRLAWLEEICQPTVPLGPGGLDRLPDAQADELRRSFVVFQSTQHAEEGRAIADAAKKEDTRAMRMDNKEAAATANINGNKRKRPAPAPAPAHASNLNILEAAYRWKQRKLNQNSRLSSSTTPLFVDNM